MDEQALVKKFARYQKHPVEYCREILGVTLSPEQADVLNALVKNSRVSVRSGNGWGKSFVLACAAMWHFDCFPGSKTLTTSGSARQVRYTLWSEISKLAQNSKLKDSYTINNTDISRVGHPSWYILGFSSDEQGRVEGHHGAHLLIIADECRSISDDVILGLFKCATEPGNRLLFGSIPGGCEGLFHATHTRLKSTWKCFCFPVVRYKHGKWKTLYPDRISQESVDEKAALEGPESPFFKASCLAEFMTSTEDSLISETLIEKARQNQLDPGNAPLVFGCDIARLGRDSSSLCSRRGGVILSFRQKRGMDLISTGTWCELETQGQTLLLDGCGIGISIYDQLKAKGRGDVHAIIVSERARDPERFYNLRCELFYNLKVRFEKGLIDLSQLDQETYQKLKQQLSTLKFSFRAGRMLLGSKEDLKRRGLPSPDLADSLALSFARENSGQWFTPIAFESETGRLLHTSWEDHGPVEPDYGVKTREQRARAGEEPTGIYAIQGDAGATFGPGGGDW